MKTKISRFPAVSLAVVAMLANCTGTVTGTVTGKLVGPAVAGNNFTFSVVTVSNQSYTIQRNDDLTTANWIFFTNFTGDGSLLQLVSPVTNAPQRYFRLRQP